MKGKRRLLLLQLPVPQLNQYRKTLNIPLAPAWISAALSDIEGIEVEIIGQSEATYLADRSLMEHILSRAPDMVGLTLYLWNTDRGLYLAKEIKERIDLEVIVGGPEVTPDNPYIRRPWVDMLVYGEGEGILRERLLAELERGSKRQWDFSSQPSPYTEGLIPLGLEGVMLLETQRGCPFRCSYCYYPKSIRGIKRLGPKLIGEAISWGHRNGAKEIYIMDPSFDSRPDCEGILRDIMRINRDRRFTLTTELRVEGLTERRADLMKDANFNMVEIGLQSTSPSVLGAIGRKTDLNRFLRGVELLKERGIETKIDLILGLPNETLESFEGTMRFMVQNGLYYDSELFLLSVLPGTRLRAQAREFQMEYMEYPPYHVLKTNRLSQGDIISAWSMAEDILDCNFNPPPFLDIAYKKNGRLPKTMEEGGIVRKLILGKDPPEDPSFISKRLFHPYQIIVLEGCLDLGHLKGLIGLFTSQNPFTPFELVIFEPPLSWDPYEIVESVKIYYPHYLDMEYRFKLAPKERGCVVITLVSTDDKRHWEGYLTRQIYWWKRDTLPNRNELKRFEHLDGILLDGFFEKEKLQEWQNRFYLYADELPAISFADESIQRAWIHKCYPEDFVGDQNIF